MSLRPVNQKAVILALGISSVTVVGQTLAMTQFGPAPVELKKTVGFDKDHRVTSDALGGPQRYLTSISIDKPIYRTGEQVYIRGVVLNAANHQPLAGSVSAKPKIEITNPTGNVIAYGYLNTENSVWSASWTVPAQSPGGQYKIRAVYQSDVVAPASRSFDVRVFREPRLKWQIKFERDGYGPGDKVTATLDVKRAEGGIPAGAKVGVTALLDGAEIKGAPAVVGANGLCPVSIQLPAKIARGEGTLALAIEDGGVVETASKTLPIILQTVDMQIFPEGGELVAGYKNRVYFQANQPNGKPADLVGKIIEKSGSHTEIVGEFHTEHEGRGRFEFTPQVARQYFLSVSKPSGINHSYALPVVRSAGAVIRTDKDVYKKGEPITLQVGCTEKQYEVTLAQREVEIGDFNSKSGGANRLQSVNFNVPSDLDGVLIATVWSKSGVPLAERLIFREPSKSVHVSITSAQKTYSPGNAALLTVKTTDDKGKPVASVVGITVTDDSVLELVDKREQAPRLGAMVFFEHDVKDLADAHVYLDSTNAKAPLDTDLLLGTQGWRRFAFVRTVDFLKEYGDKARDVLAVQRLRSSSMQLNGPQVRPNALNRGRVGFDVLYGQPMKFNQLLLKNKADQGALNSIDAGAIKLPADIGRVEGPRDLNLFQVEPTVIDERHYVSGRDERHQKTSPTLPEGSPIPDSEDGLGLSTAPQGGNNVVFLREFAHSVRRDRKPHDRMDFTNTLYWNAAVITNPISGEANIRFGMDDSITTFKVTADAFTGNGALGEGTKILKSADAFYAEAKLPLEVTAGDKVALPVTLVNTTGNVLDNSKLSVSLSGDFKVERLPDSVATLKPNERKRVIENIDVGNNNNGERDFVLDVKSGNFTDRVTRKLLVKPSGFPAVSGIGGMLEPGKSVTRTLTIPADVVSASTTTNAVLYVSPLASLTEALQRLIQDPSGCFEQTSSTSYPLTMAQQYFLTHTGVDPKLIETSRKKLDDGYKKLVAFWCPDRGYEWFGQDPGHEALTAFGLLHFSDMSKVREVDQNMVATTRAWLLKQRDGLGGFSRKRRALHTWIEDKDCSNAYILWALLETGQSPADLKLELQSLKTAAATSQNSYVLALAANAFYLAGDKAETKRLMERLVAKQKEDGSIDGVTSSIVGSGGESLEIEGTALTTLAWLREPEYAVQVEKSMKYLANSCKEGRYASTQATVLALRAVVEYDKQRSKSFEPGRVQVLVDGQTVGDWVHFDQKSQGALKLPDLSESLGAGTHKIELRMEGGKQMPYSIAVNYNVKTPASSKDCKLDISTKLAKNKLQEGTPSEADVLVINTSDKTVPNPIAIVGLPGGLEPRHDQLKELLKKQLFDAYEVRGREIVFYWRSLGARERRSIPISLIAAIPGSYTGPASRAYLYYSDEDKKWVEGLHADIAAK
ncbi:MAG TPA: MG2 domain-containing protein [Oculatellaceae cyanobacterium]